MTISEFKSITYSICLINATRRTSQYIKNNPKNGMIFNSSQLLVMKDVINKGITIRNTLAHG
jgi:hypothetical protein